MNPKSLKVIALVIAILIVAVVLFGFLQNTIIHKTTIVDTTDASVALLHNIQLDNTCVGQSFVVPADGDSKIGLLRIEGLYITEDTEFLMGLSTSFDTNNQNWIGQTTSEGPETGPKAMLAELSSGDTVAQYDGTWIVTPGNTYWLMVKEYTGDFKIGFVSNTYNSGSVESTIAWNGDYSDYDLKCMIRSEWWNDEPSSVPELSVSQDSILITDELSVTASASDPEGRTLNVQFDWDDGEYSSWFPLTGSSITKTHYYTSVGTYSVRARSQDADWESEWSDSITVTVSTEGDDDDDDDDKIGLPTPNLAIPTTVKKGELCEIPITFSTSASSSDFNVKGYIMYSDSTYVDNYGEDTTIPVTSTGNDWSGKFSFVPEHSGSYFVGTYCVAISGDYYDSDPVLEQLEILGETGQTGYTLLFTVLDTSGNPILGALVEANSVGQITNASGKTTFSFDAGEEVSWEATKSLYTPVSDVLTMDKSKEATVYLKKLSDTTVNESEFSYSSLDAPLSPLKGGLDGRIQLGGMTFKNSSVIIVIVVLVILALLSILLKIPLPFKVLIIFIGIVILTMLFILGVL